jgi:hypothetical protein
MFIESSEHPLSELSQSVQQILVNPLAVNPHRNVKNGKIMFTDEDMLV